jgi:hypothetical protein
MTTKVKNGTLDRAATYNQFRPSWGMAEEGKNGAVEQATIYNQYRTSETMTKDDMETQAFGNDSGIGGCVLWFVWGVSLSLMTVMSFGLLILVVASIALNLYLGWELSGIEVSVSRSEAGPLQAAPAVIPTTMLAAIPTNTPEIPPVAALPPAEPSRSPLEAHLATISAIATEIALTQLDIQSAPGPVAVITPTPLPTGAPAAVAINPPDSQPTVPEAISAAPTPAAASAAVARVPVGSVDEAQTFAPPATSSNRYSLIPINGERDSRPAAEHGDLNLKLREPQPIQRELALVDIKDAGIDSNAPKLSDVFEPKFVKLYTIHDWDWGCNCKGQLIQDEQVVLVGIDTTPGEPVFIPTKEQDIFGGKFYAVVLYASEDSLTFVYEREGAVATGYSVHYLGLHTDPNLLVLYRDSKGSELPGLTLDTPVGVAGDELIVAIRDRGTFLDARSRKDWWD